MQIEEVSVLCIFSVSYCQIQKWGLWMVSVWYNENATVFWNQVLLSSIAGKYKLCSSIWWNYPGFYKNTRELGICRWGQQSKEMGIWLGVWVSCWKGSHSQGQPCSKGAAFIPGSAAGPDQSCSPSTLLPCVSLARDCWCRPHSPAHCPGWGGSVGLLPAKVATDCLVIMHGSQLPLLIPHNKCG